VFGVKEKLIVEFEKHPAGKTPTGENSAEPFLVVNYDFTLSKSKSQNNNGKTALSEAGRASHARL
jgi:hypothetical protein